MPAASASRRPSARSSPSNLTPHQEAGIGRWSAAHFWRALHNGRSMDGRLLYPAFPYPSFTRVTREDSDAIYAYLRTVPPAPTPNTAAQAALPLRHAGRARGVARAVLRARQLRRRSGKAGRVEPRRLPGRGPGPLHRLPRHAQRAGRHRGEAGPLGRADPGRELVCAFAEREARGRRRGLGHAARRRAAQERHLAARLGDGPDGRRGLPQHPAPERGRPERDGGVPQAVARSQGGGHPRPRSAACAATPA